jgi:hypothetical protein
VIFFHASVVRHVNVPVPKVEEVGAAHPRIVEAVETMVKKGKWTVPGRSSLLFLVFVFLNILWFDDRLQGEIWRFVSSVDHRLCYTSFIVPRPGSIRHIKD